jgi:hypothetical protein
MVSQTRHFYAIFMPKPSGPKSASKPGVIDS